MMIFLIPFFLFTLPAFAENSVDRLKQIVEINSGSANLKGVLSVQEKIKPWFEELGFKVTFKKNPRGENVSAPILIATFPGEKTEFITFIMHADTVFEPSSPFQKWEMIDDHTMRGPGVIDNKGGIIVALEAFKNYFDALKTKNQKPKYSLQVEVTPNEEVGAIGWDELFKEMSKQSYLAIGLEPSVEEGIVEGRKGNVWYEISVTGKEAHAGVNHHLGVNACDILSDKIHQIQKLTSYQKNVTASIGHIEGGQDKYNIVCGWAKAKIDTRVPSLKAREQLNAKIETILKSPNIAFKIVDETVPMSSNAASKPLVKKYLEIITKVEGRHSKAHVSGGVGDVNHFAREGLAAFDGLGPIGQDMHTPQEKIDLRSLSTRAKVLSEFLLSL